MLRGSYFRVAASFMKFYRKSFHLKFISILDFFLMMTTEQEKDAERLDRYIVRERLSSIMNDTKWHEAINALLKIVPSRMKFRFKCVRDPESPINQWEVSFPYHIPIPYKTIEWLDIDPLVRIFREQLVSDEINDYTHEIVNAFNTINVPFILHNGIIRIQGYIRSNQH